MPTSDQSTDETLLAALAERLHERRGALAQAAEMLGEMRAVNAKLEAAERLKGRFLSNIRNEINNPLTTLRGFAAAIATNPDLPREQVTALAAGMYRDVSDLAFQMQNIFAAADFEAGCAAPDFARVHVSGFIAEIVADLRSIAEAKNIAIDVTMPDGLTVVTDPAKVALILTNLLRNALEFGRAKVNLSIVQEDETLVLDVRDDGPGIAVEESARVFDRFVQLSEGSTKSHPGHGLGLSIARACAEVIGGSIEVLDTPGAGAHFRLQFPVGSPDSHGEEADAANEFLFEVLETF